MLKRSNAWDLQSRTMMTSRNNLVTLPPLDSKRTGIPRFNYELSPQRWDRMGMSFVLHGLALLLIVQLAIWLPRPHVEKERFAPVAIYVPVPPRPVQKLPPPPPPKVL